MNAPILAPSVMCLDQWQSAADTLLTLQRLGVQVVHADIMDGEFVPNLMLGTESVKTLRRLTPCPWISI